MTDVTDVDSPDPEELERHRSTAFFWVVTAYPRLILALSAIIMIVAAFGLTQLTRDSNFEAFLPPSSQALQDLRDLEANFGETGVIALALHQPGEGGIYTPEALALVDWWSQAFADIPGVNSEGILSLSTLPRVSGESGMLEVGWLIDGPITTQSQADDLRLEVQSLPQWARALVSEGGDATLIVAQLEGDASPESVYDAAFNLMDKAPPGAAETHLAGDGAITGRMGSYIDADAQSVFPSAAVIIVLILLLAYRSLFGLILPGMVAFGAAGVAIGAMALYGTPFYVITNALPSILLGIGVADAIHILQQFFEEREAAPDAPHRLHVSRAMAHMWRPVTTTSLSDGAGLLAMGLMSSMPPLQAFGAWASVGVVAALAFSLFTLPAAMTLFPPKRALAISSEGGDRAATFMAKGGGWIIDRAPWVIGVAILAIAVAGVGALDLESNEERRAVFHPEEPIYKADVFINEHLIGTQRLDLVLKVKGEGTILEPEILQGIRRAQAEINALPGVGASSSVVDFMSALGKAMEIGTPQEGSLPDTSQGATSLLGLYGMSGDGPPLGSWITDDGKGADIHIHVKTGVYSELVTLVKAIEDIQGRALAFEDVEVELVGPVMVDMEWVGGIAPSHFKGLGVALLAIFLMTALSFRSLLGGFLCLLPVSAAVLFVYGYMGVMGIWLGVGGSMFAAIAIGFGVDFAIHTLERVKDCQPTDSPSLDAALRGLYPSTGRALLFSLLTILLSFGTLTTSDVPPLNHFGWLGGIALLTSFMVSITLLPALIKRLEPAFLMASPSKSTPTETPP